MASDRRDVLTRVSGCPCVVAWLKNRLESERYSLGETASELVHDYEHHIRELDNQLQLLRAGIVNEASQESIENALQVLSSRRNGQLRQHTSQRR
jgi:hypothetical protein